MPPRRENLTRYKQKRDFSKTSEPEGIVEKKKGYRYLIQKHDATRLHYDFRLELDGVLKSWAVTRGPSLDPADKRLAVEVEDHPVSYGAFEGTIPKGQYGGGTVMLWDEGSWEPLGDPRKGLEKGKLEFKLHGKRLQGEWTLVRMHDREKDKGRHNWLLIKHHDEFVQEGNGDVLLEENNTSVTSGRSMDKIASDPEHVWQSKSVKKTPEAKQPAPRKIARKKFPPLPAFIAPELATLSDTMPQGKNWVHEIKFDGYRGLAYIENGQARIHTRTGKDWTDKFQLIADKLATLGVSNAILDGEIVAIDDKGASSFKMLQEALTNEDASSLQYYIFDLLYLNGKDMMKLPLLERKDALKSLLENEAGGTIFYSEHFTHKGNEFLQSACDMRLEGIISKRSDAPYHSGRGKSWLKTKCHKRQEFVIGGFTYPTHDERGIGALLLGYFDGDKFTYAGKVGTGFTNDTSLDIRKKLDKLSVKEKPFAEVPADGRRGAHWVKPLLVCEVEFTEWTEDGRLRHPSFQGLRQDKPAKTVHRDVALHIVKETKTPVKAAVAAKASSTKRSKSDAVVGGIKITHPDRIIYPDEGITKLQLAQYYEAVADAILPYVANRPLSMLRCPEGTGKACFFQRHIALNQSPHLYDTGVKVKDRNESYLMIKDAKGLLTLIQWGVIELHPWGAKADKPDMPDRIIFDLDPDPEVPWKYVIEGALNVRERMKELGLESFLKTTGGKGLHVTVPLQRKYNWDTIKAFARAVADSMQHDEPNRYIATMSKEKRKGKIFVDYLRNDLTATAIAPFAARARAGATVATPLAWQELKPTLKPAQFTIETVPLRLQKLKTDPWSDFSKLKQTISANYLKALKITAK